MTSLVHAASHFYGSHRLSGHPTCDRECGHAWGVRVAVTGEPVQEYQWMPVDETALLTDLRRITDELKGKDIDAMIRPSVSSLIGLASWFDSRLSHKYEIVEVVVWNDELTSATLRK